MKCFLFVIQVFLCGLTLSGAQCPADYSDHPLILMSLDGFRPDYLGRQLTPTLQALVEGGVSVPFMKATYPTVTFPNHYSIVTGLYPESHGIIANYFRDEHLNDTFTKSTGTTVAKWWLGEPIWTTVRKQNKASATFFWPGSEVEENGPTYWYPYDNSIPFVNRIEQVLAWLVLPSEERPQWISVYFNEPDHTAHRAGPDSTEVNEQLIRMDGIVKLLIDGIAEMNLTDCVNLIIVSDHGMAKAGQEKVVHIDQYVPDLEQHGKLFHGANSRIDVFDNEIEYQEEIMENLTCKVDSMRQFDKTTIPKRFHFTNNVRIENIILDFNAGHQANFESNSYEEGLHGYDNDFRDMQALFIANGPDFLSGLKVDPFQNIELYNLMCDLLDLNPAQTNGTKGALYHIMRSPPAYPDFPPGTTAPINKFPTHDELPSRLNTSGCDEDLVTSEDWVASLNMTDEEIVASERLHLPWGAPYTVDSIPAHITLLHHSDHITGFSSTLKMPLWTSYTLQEAPSGTSPSFWSTDVRLVANETPTCSSYESLLSLNMTMTSLFRPEHASASSDPRQAYLVSNAIPMTAELQYRYLELMTELIPAWIKTARSPVNVVSGVVFDNNFDSLVDNYTEFSGPPNPPSEIFTILTRCDRFVTDLKDCPVEHLDLTAFIYHQKHSVPNCMVRDHFAEEYSARVKDVELATGLVFYPSLTYAQAMRLSLHLHLDIWTTIFD